jgi:hypothetical protein
MNKEKQNKTKESERACAVARMSEVPAQILVIGLSHQ